jgi:hypothetical protein
MCVRMMGPNCRKCSRSWPERKKNYFIKKHKNPRRPVIQSSPLTCKIRWSKRRGGGATNRRDANLSSLGGRLAAASSVDDWLSRACAFACGMFRGGAFASGGPLFVSRSSFAVHKLRRMMCMHAFGCWIPLPNTPTSLYRREYDMTFYRWKRFL